MPKPPEPNPAPEPLATSDAVLALCRKLAREWGFPADAKITFIVEHADGSKTKIKGRVGAPERPPG